MNHNSSSQASRKIHPRSHQTLCSPLAFWSRLSLPAWYLRVEMPSRHLQQTRACSCSRPVEACARSVISSLLRVALPQTKARPGRHQRASCAAAVHSHPPPSAWPLRAPAAVRNPAAGSRRPVEACASTSSPRSPVVVRLAAVAPRRSPRRQLPVVVRWYVLVARLVVVQLV